MDKDIPINPEDWLDDHGDYLFQCAYVRLRNTAAAEDAVQETFLAAFKAMDRYDKTTPVRYWLRGILHHKVVDHIRKAAREIAVEDTEDLEILDRFEYKAFGIAEHHPAPWKFDPKHAYEQKEFWEVFYGCMANLKENAGKVFTLRELEGLSTEEICKELGINPNNVWVLLHRARVQLKACLEQKWSKP